MKNGIIVVNKEAGCTSFRVVSILRRLLNEKKIGHMGTLDPDATGVLPVCVGRATKLLELIPDHDKAYEAVMRLGIITDTYDLSGQILEEKPVDLSEESVQRAIGSFVGSYMQLPPMYSAKRVDGRRLYELAREGVTVDRQASEVNIYSIDIKWVKLPDVCIEVACSKGTYIRSLAYDIGQKLGCGASIVSLKRTKACGYDIAEARTLEEIEAIIDEGRLDEILKPMEDLLEYKKLWAAEEIKVPVIHGAYIHNFSCITDENGRDLNSLLDEQEISRGQLIRLFYGDYLCGIYMVEKKELKVIKFLADPDEVK